MKGVTAGIKAVIFDLDGTLIKFKLDIVGMKKEIIRRLSELNIPRNLLSLDIKIVDMIKISKEYLLRINREDLASKVVPLIFSIADEFEIKAAKVSELIDDAKLVLRCIKELGLKVGLLTNNGRLATNIVLEKHNIAEFFDVIITRDDSQALKPDPAGLRLVLSALNVSSEETIFVGDSVIDARAANEIGVPFFGIKTGLHKKDDLQKEKAIMVFDSLKGFLQFILEKINKDLF
ncbi:MAG: HAD family hydrolase [Candidatus Baldrarchaeia archaeon]